MKDKTFEFSQNWENDGMLVWKNAKTLNRYHELCEERDKTDAKKYRCFYAFSKEQFEQGQKSIRLKPNERLVSFGGGSYGTQDGINKMFAHIHDILNRLTHQTLLAVLFTRSSFREK